jgi:hypothetical protein
VQGAAGQEARVAVIDALHEDPAVGVRGPSGVKRWRGTDHTASWTGFEGAQLG